MTIPERLEAARELVDRAESLVEAIPEIGSIDSEIDDALRYLGLAYDSLGYALDDWNEQNPA